MKICFETFGCRLNRAEALEQEAKYLAAGHTITSSHQDADLIVIRGCSVTRRAQRDTEKLIEHLKVKYPLKHLKLEGCIDKSKVKTAALHEEDLSKFGDAIPTRTARAYLKVQDGCNGKCTFCIVPSFRGESRSSDFDEVIDKAKRFIDLDYREIVVTGCNLALYASHGKRLPELLSSLASLSKDVRIRLGSLESWLCAKEVVDVFSENANICRFLHLPVQSGSNRILESMRRPYRVEDVEEIANYALERMPGIALGCDMIAGFPGETEFDAVASQGLLKRIPFTNGHIFPYSERPGTLAVAFPGQVPRDIRHARARLLDRIVKETRNRHALKHVGHEVEIVMESENHPGGWTSDYFWCKITNFTNAKRKELVKVRVMDAKDGILHGFNM